MAQFIDYDNYQHFCLQQQDTPAVSDTPGEAKTTKLRLPLFILLALIIGTAFFLTVKTWRATSDSRAILKSGQTFANYDDFLSLFDIHASDCRYFQAVPKCSVAYVWAPQYNHPNYHNAGNPDSLMPTITEYISLKPLDDSPESRKLLLEANRKWYLTAIRNNQVRVVFMKDLPGDTCFTFTGIYCVSYALSDTTKVVWTRMSQECDLNHLEVLDRLRN